MGCSNIRREAKYSAIRSARATTSRPSTKGRVRSLSSPERQHKREDIRNALANHLQNDHPEKEGDHCPAVRPTSAQFLKILRQTRIKCLEERKIGLYIYQPGAVLDLSQLTGPRGASLPVLMPLNNDMAGINSVFAAELWRPGKIQSAWNYFLHCI